MINIYNQLTKKIEPFEPLIPGKVTMYCCGPTVYDYIHIGNARSAIIFDLIRRYFIYSGYEVTYVSNFTDVDDKIIKVAQQSKTTPHEISKKFINAYFKDTDFLGVKRADKHPLVTDNINEIITFIKKLEDKGFTYESQGNVYFRTHLAKNYGKLSGQPLDKLKNGARVEVNFDKESSLDFTLWKKSKVDELGWDSPWGKGRPGWHIECSSMILNTLGETIDIHAGGKDLIFPHHENEIAQSEALTKKPLANYWMHNGFVTINNDKMSKSLNNSILVKDLMQKYPVQLIRFFILSVHYSRPINFSEELLEQSWEGLERLNRCVFSLDYRLFTTSDVLFTDTNELQITLIRDFKQRIMDEMNNNFNTANVISVLFEVSKAANVYLQSSKKSSSTVILAYLDIFQVASTILGIHFNGEVMLLTKEIENLIAEREIERSKKNYARSDEIRELLKKKNVLLEDSVEGVRWRRTE